MKDDYDPKTCVTACQLRNLGMEVPEGIPDCAWVPRSSMRFGQASSVARGNGVISMHANVHFEVPFRWVEVITQKTSLSEGNV